MPGNRYLLDTNALVALLQGNPELAKLTQQAHWLGVSVINVLEFSSFDGLGDQDRYLLSQLVARITVVDVAYGNNELMTNIIALRQTRALKLPDAIVMASAALYQATVLTNDTQLLNLGKADSGYRTCGFSVVE
ncbi:MAG: twitching motility protein PilT [Comamonadaceae bacterium CG_4_9_14_0_8_um_filter_60_18]